MFCPNCGTENPDYANFCEKCGHTLGDLQEETSGGTFLENTMVHVLADRKQMIIGGCILLAAVLICVVALLWHSGLKEEYKNQIQNAGRYLQALNYDKAEAAYLEAIKIDPKKKDSYIQLADLYMKQGRRNEAIAILKKGKQNVESETAGTTFDNKIEEVEAGEDSYSYVEKTVIPATGLADLGTFPDDESNRLGMVSAWIEDFDHDGQEEILTTATEEYKVTDMRIRLYDKQEGNMVMIGELPPEVSASGTVSYGDHSCEIFAKEQNGNFYLAVKKQGMSQSYSSSYTNLGVFKIEKGLEQQCVTQTEWYRGSESVSLNGETIYSVTDDEAAERSSEDKGSDEAAALELIREALEPYGFEDKAEIPEKKDTGSGILLLGCDEDDLSEKPISNHERKQTGARTVEGNPEMQVFVEDFTDIRRYLKAASQESQTAENIEEGELRRADITTCVGMSKSEIESRFGELSGTGNYWSGGEEYVFSDGHDGIRVYFQVVSELPDDQNTCTGIGGTVGNLLDGWRDNSLSIETFSKRSGVSLEEAEIDDEYYGEFDDGCRLMLYVQEGVITQDTSMAILPPAA